MCIYIYISLDLLHLLRFETILFPSKPWLFDPIIQGTQVVRRTETTKIAERERGSTCKWVPSIGSEGNNINWVDVILWPKKYYICHCEKKTTYKQNCSKKTNLKNVSADSPKNSSVELCLSQVPNLFWFTYECCWMGPWYSDSTPSDNGKLQKNNPSH